MELNLTRHLWGVDEAWETAFPKFKADGYSGIEYALFSDSDRARMRKLLDQHGLFGIAMVFTGGITPEDHLKSLREHVQAAVTIKPRFINSHSGSDAWTLAECVRYFTGALQIEKEFGTPICHETHRGRPTYNPWTTRDIITAVPDLKLACDFSHWVCVCERLINDQLDIIRLCAERTLHIHARVGYEQGPQVPDPRAPEYQAHVEAHEKWWDIIFDAQNAKGAKSITLTPEFGPPGYMHTLPYSNMPVANLWDICNWQAKRQAERFAKGAWHGAASKAAAAR